MPQRVSPEPSKNPESPMLPGLPEDPNALRERELDDADTLRKREEIATHLANERTFIAWSFTGIVIIGSGVALARTLIALNTSPLSSGAARTFTAVFYPTTMGLLFLAAGLAVVVMAACRYLSVQAQITHQRYRPSSTMVLVFLTIILGLCIVLAGFLLQLRGTL